MSRNDERRLKPGPNSDTYVNPILGGDYPDPSVLRVGKDYYMTHSSFNYSPGLLVWHSRNLVDWEPVCQAVPAYPGNVWAPDFIEHQCRYYIYYPSFTLPHNHSNWVVHAPSPKGPWSSPIDLQVGHIDPGHVVGPDGKRYLMLSGGNLVQLTDDGLATVGEVRRVYDGWPLPEDWVIESFALESPKFTRLDGWYYLTVAEGGTAGPATSHSVVQSRSRTPWGPWEHSPYNPLVHTASRDERWWSRGHGTLVDTPDGRWYVMYHAYERGYHTLGRQTLLEPLQRTDDGWFRPVDNLDIAGPIAMPPGDAVAGRLTLSDDFTGDSLGLQWRFYEPSPWTCEEPGCARLRFTHRGIVMAAEDSSPMDSRPMLCIPTDHAYEVEVELDAPDGTTGGLVLYYNEQANCGVATSAGGSDAFLWRRGREWHQTTGGSAVRRLKLANDRHEVTFYVDRGDGWHRFPSGIETSGFHHNVFDGFVSLRVGILACGRGHVTFRNFRYRSLPPE